MDLSWPLRSMIPSLDSDVLAVLARTESSLGAAQIAGLAARGSRQGVTNVLDRLTAHGLVLARTTNKGHAYQLNREHLLVPSLLAALDTRTRILELLTAQMRMLDGPPLHASVFGSFARGDAGPDSDIDLLIVTADGGDRRATTWVDQLHAVEDRVLRATGNRLEPLVLSRGGLRAARVAGEPLISSLSAESIRILGQTFDELVEGEDVG